MSIPLPGRPHSLRTLLVLESGAIVALALIAYSFAIYILDISSLSEAIDQSLAARAKQVRRAVERNPQFGRRPIEIELPETFASSDVFVQVLSPDGRTLGRSENLEDATLPFDAQDLAAVTAGQGRYKEAVVGGERLRIYTAPLPVPEHPIEIVQVARSLAPVEETEGRLLRIVAVGLPVTLVLSALLIWLRTGTALRPLEDLTETAASIGSTTDLTARVPTPRSDDEVGRLAATLNYMLEQLQGSDAQLREAYTKLERALDAQRRFIADASHELQTPLTIVRGNANLLSQFHEVSEEDRTAALKQINEDAERMSRLIQRLLILARTDAGLPVQRVPVALGPLLEAVVAQAHVLASGQQVQLDVVEPVEVLADLDALHQIILNLLENAIKYTPPGGGIRLSVEADADEVHVLVADTGVGISPEHLPRIFERFYQADPSRKDLGEGLGLAVAQALARQHGGSIEVASEPGQGTVFTVRLPRAGTGSFHTDGPHPPRAANSYPSLTST